MRKFVETPKAPKALASYSQGIVYEGKLLFTAGQIGIDPETMELVPGGISRQMEQVMNNIEAVLEAGFSSFEKVLKTTVYLVNITDYATINEIYARYFGEDLPARATVQVAALPKGALVEVECIAGY